MTTVTITEPPTLSFTTSVTSSCTGKSTGSASVSVSGGTPSYTYNWSTTPTQTGITASGLPAGTYTATITDANGCVDTAIATIGSVPSPTVTVTDDTTICSGQNITLSASDGGNYLWNSGATTSTISVSPTSTTNYFVASSNGFCADTAFLIVTVNQKPIIFITGDTIICKGDSTVLIASGGSNYLWNTGTTTSSITVNPSSSTSYSITVANTNGCTASSIINIVVSSPPTAIVSGATICAGQNTTITVSGGGNYLWSNGSTNSTISVSPSVSTTYSVVVSIGTCKDTASTSVIVNPMPNVNVTGNTIITQGTSTTLTATLIDKGIYSWNNGSTGSSIVVAPLLTTIYCVNVTIANICSDSSCITVYIDTVDCFSSQSPAISNIFSPNGDNINDLFSIEGMDKCPFYSLRIYDRWGKLIFQSEEKNKYWDGTTSTNEKSPDGTYYYIINNEVNRKKGFVTLLR